MSTVCISLGLPVCGGQRLHPEVLTKSWEKVRRPEKGMMEQVRAKLGVERLSRRLRAF